MKENTDPQQVVLSREMFDELIQAAYRGDFEAGNFGEGLGIAPRALRHARKFNRPLREEHQRAVEQERRSYKELRQKTIDLINNHHGESVLVKKVFSAYPAKILGRDQRSKFCVIVEGPDPSKLSRDTARYSAHAREIELSEKR